MMARKKAAKPFLRKAVTTCNKALEHYRSGLFQAARIGFELSLQHESGYPEALHGLGVLELQDGNFTRAINLIGRAIQESRAAPVNYYYNLGGALRKSGDFTRATSCYRIAFENGVHHPVALREMGSVFRAAGLYPQAVECFSKLVSAGPNDSENHCLLGIAQSAAGNHAAAIYCYRTALALDPVSTRVLSLLGHELYTAEQEQGGIEMLSRAVAARPDDLALRRSLASHLASYGEIEAARAEYEQLIGMGDGDGTRMVLATPCPVIMPSTEAIHRWRAQLDRALNGLMDQQIHIEDPVTSVENTNFFLAYHGLDDAPLQKKIAQVFTRACPVLDFTAPHCGSGSPLPVDGKKIRIGLISRHFRGHSIGKTSIGLIRLLPRDRFHVVVLFIGHPVAELGREINNAADAAVYLSSTLTRAQQQVAGLALDILFYQDIGMEPLTYFLSFARLAPIQCTSFGHPVTTGVPNIDYYISAQAWETDDSDAHYTERLVRLRDVSSVAYYYPPAMPKIMKDRQYFGLDDIRHIYVCPQTIFKFHPDFDALLAGILRRDPLGNIVLIKGRPAHWAELLRERFQRTIPDVAGRIIFLPRQLPDDFKNLIAVSDVALDTIHFCGFNTTMEAFAAGIPVVTLPGSYMRSRHTAAFYTAWVVLTAWQTTSRNTSTSPHAWPVIRSSEAASCNVLNRAAQRCGVKTGSSASSRPSSPPLRPVTRHWSITDVPETGEQCRARSSDAGRYPIPSAAICAPRRSRHNSPRRTCAADNPSPRYRW
jgi:predicted O-linked N-acetylglucosamine transferase (SPINDLY family)